MTKTRRQTLILELVDHDEISSQEMLQRRLRARGVAISLVDHRLQALLAVADRAVALHQGRVIAEGQPEAVIESPAVLEAYLGEPAP